MRRSAAAMAFALGSLMFLAGWPVQTIAPAGAVDEPGVDVTLQQVVGGLARPILVTHAGDGSGRMFIALQGGVVRYMVGGVLQPDSWLDVTSKVTCCGERGLLGMAFYPDFETTGRLIISYTRAGDGASVLERLTVATPGGKPPADGFILLTVAQPFSNHNGGNVLFGPDGYLYFGLGDGGSGGDPQNHGQNKNSLLGKMLRLDVSGPAGYTIPPDNPYATTGGRPEIWNIGLRNPWRFSFDRLTGDLWIGDVGQNLYEEIDFQPAGLGAGRNYGWRGWEGQHPYNPSQALQELADPLLTFPILEYTHGAECSVTGGYVYRGPGHAALQGKYIYGDYCSGQIWTAEALPLALPPLPALPMNLPLLLPTYTGVPLVTASFDISSFGEDEAGNLYVVAYAATGGGVYRLAE